MNIVKAHFKGFKTATRFPRMLFVIYAGNLILSLLVALPFFGILKEHTGNSIQIKQLLKDFDFITFNNLLANGSDAFNVLFSQTLWVGIAYFLLNVFFVGGILEIAKQKKFSVSTFFGGSGKNFFRMFFLNLIMLACHIVLILAILLPSKWFLPNIFGEQLSVEGKLYTILSIAGFVYVILAVLLLIISDYAKNYMVHKESANFLTAFFRSIGFVFKHFFKTYTLFLLLIVLPIAFFTLYFFVDGKVAMTNPKAIIIIFLVQQAFIFTRIWFRIWILSAQYEMYVDDLAKDELKKIERMKKKVQRKEQKALAQKQQKQTKKRKKEKVVETKTPPVEKKKTEKREKKEKKEKTAKTRTEKAQEPDVEKTKKETPATQITEDIMMDSEEFMRRRDEDLLDFG